MTAIAHPATVAAAAGRHHWQQGLDLAAHQRWHEAARAFGRATRAAPHDALYWVNLAHAQRKGGQLQRAVAAARRALRVAPRDVVALRVLGDCLLQLHRYAEAAEAFARLDTEGQADPESLLQQASALQAQLRHTEAGETLLRALTMQPDNVRAHALLADCFRDRGFKREAWNA